MFTGIVQSVGAISDVIQVSNGVGISVNLNELNSTQLNLGDSIAVNGVCLTVTELDNETARFDVSKESISKTLIKNWQKGDLLNLEMALTLQSFVGGHLVSGHVDGIATLIASESEDKFTMMKFETSKSIGKFIAGKGSVAIDGVSLTSNRVADVDDRTIFDLMLIPHTLSNTTLGNLSVGDSVHVEVDQIARYIKRIIECKD